MSIIVIPLRSEKTSSNWNNDSYNLQKLVDGIGNDISVIVCGHEAPNFLAEKKYEAVTFVEAQHPVPKSSNEFMRDKLLKKIAGAIHAQEIMMDKDLFMYSDADDLVSPSIFSAARSTLEDDFLLSVGYIYDVANKNISLIGRGAPPFFYKTCGTCLVSKVTKDDMPSRDSVSKFIARLTDHTKYDLIAKEHGRSVYYSQDPYVCYMVNHGGNDHSLRGANDVISNIIKKNPASDSDIKNFNKLF